MDIFPARIHPTPEEPWHSLGIRRLAIDHHLTTTVQPYYKQKAHCHVLLQCAFWFDVILVSESLLGFGEDDLVDEEENHHRHTAVQNGGADVIDEVRHKQSGYGDPHAVDGVDDAGDDAERHHIPRDLLAQVALAAEHEIALDGEVDALANDHGNHIRAEVRQAAVGGIVAEDVPLEGFAKQGHIHAGPAEIHHRQTAERSGQKLQQQILEHGN